MPFDDKMAEMLCAYREVAILKEAAATSKEPTKAVAIISYDEKPGIQAIATAAPDLPPKPGEHASLARDYEYKRNGTLSLLAGIDLLTGEVHALVKDRHRSREFNFFSKLTRSVLRHIRVVSKQELKDRIMAAIDHFNQTRVVHTGTVARRDDHAIEHEGGRRRRNVRRDGHR